MPDLPVDGIAPGAPAFSSEFARKAMATIFRVQLVEDNAVYARQAAAAAFEELELLERLLSRYEESSDVSRINRLSAGQQTVIAVETFACLSVAQQLKRWTQGAFDVAYASNDAGRTAGFRLHRARCTVQVLDHRVQIDLGGIGKGFALDRMMHVLHEWDITAAMLWAGSSTVFAFGTPRHGENWTVNFGPNSGLRQQTLCSSAFSGSGTAIKGGHIVDPRTGRPVRTGRRAWAAAPRAAAADALSTAFMVMPLEDIRRCCRQDPRVAAYIADAEQPSMVAFNE